ncbi:MAG: hypothetical protein ACYDDQ_10315 [Vulcanimicrobiaceae bacterium]
MRAYSTKSNRERPVILSPSKDVTTRAMVAEAVACLDTIVTEMPADTEAATHAGVKS